MSRRLLMLAALSWSAGAGLARAEGPTFTKDVAAILLKNCAGCHRPGEIGPFSLLSYKDAAKRADDLADVTASHQMPPWKPELGFGEFMDERRLTDQEIKTIADWSKAGAPEGNPKDLPATPTFPDGWQLGKPDLVLETPAPLDIPATGKDVYRCFVIPIPIDSNKTVAAVEFRPGNRKVVHHALFFLDSSGAARKKDEADSGPGFASFGGPGFVPTGSLGGWAPGALPRKLPDGLGRRLPKGSDLVLQVHYHPDGKPEADQSMVGIYFTKTPARQIVGGFMARTRELDIPPGESRYHVAIQTEPLPADAKVIGLTPHMHYVGKEMKAVAETPDGKTIPLIWVKDWDFNWQGQYLYKSPISLPKGTVVKVDAYYDNSADNPRNPSSPPKHVGWGEQTTDEMCILFFQVTTENPVDLVKFNLMRAGGGLANRLGGVATKAAMKANGAGFVIPEAFKDRLSPFDKDNDGKLSSAEVETVPEPGRTRIKDAMGGVTTPDRPAAKATTKNAAASGFVIPEAFKERLARFDKDNDGRLSTTEVEAMPDRLKAVVRERLEAAKAKGVDKP